MASSILGQPAPVADTLYAINNASISFSDYCNLALSPVAAVFSRPSTDTMGAGLASCNPAARVRFSTNSMAIGIVLRWTNLVTNPALFNSVGSILVDGVEVRTFSISVGSSVTVTEYVSFAVAATRNIEVILPYGASVDVLGVKLTSTATLSTASARSSTRLICMGDSITQSYYASAVSASWTFNLGKLKNWQVINHGYGGRQCIPSDGTALAGLSPSVATYMIGYNDFGAQRSLVSFKADFLAFVNNFRSINTTAKLYCITPIYSTNTNTITLESYRQQIRDVLTTLANPLNVLVEGLSLMTNNANRLTDGIHPNDVGSLEIANSLNSIVVL